jgi:hypothetical protein
VQKHAPEPLVLYKLIPVSGPEAKRALHQSFDGMGLGGEWFALSHSVPGWMTKGARCNSRLGRSRHLTEVEPIARECPGRNGRLCHNRSSHTQRSRALRVLRLKPGPAAAIAIRARLGASTQCLLIPAGKLARTLHAMAWACSVG